MLTGETREKNLKLCRERKIVFTHISWEIIYLFQLDINIISKNNEFLS